MANGNSKKDSPLLEEIKRTNKDTIVEVKKDEEKHPGIVKGIIRLFQLIEKQFEMGERKNSSVSFRVMGIPFSFDTKDPGKLIVSLMIIYLFLHTIGVIPKGWKLELNHTPPIVTEMVSNEGGEGGSK